MPLCGSRYDVEDSAGNIKSVELKKDGADIDVTDANKNEYLRLLIQSKFVKEVQPQMDHIVKGTPRPLRPPVLKPFGAPSSVL